jgi:hypothetical protein
MPPPVRRRGGEDHPHVGGRRLGPPATAESLSADVPANPSVGCDCGKSGCCVPKWRGWKRSHGWAYTGTNGETRDTDKT